MSHMQDSDPIFIQFKTSLEDVSIPDKFYYPHYHEPHPLCQLAANELQQYLKEQAKWDHDFSTDPRDPQADIGKMFGVLVVENAAGELGYLCAFSGKIAGRNDHPHFVPPIVDMLKEGSFFKRGERIISDINAQVNQILDSAEYRNCKQNLLEAERESQLEISQLKAKIKSAKETRDKIRQSAQANLTKEEFHVLDGELKQQSMKSHYELKDLSRYWKKRIQSYQEQFDTLNQKLNRLKVLRKEKSNQLQLDLFNEYQFLNIKKEQKAVLNIFEEAIQDYPPSGAGDCAAPRLLQYAFQHNYKPLSMAEFWWGKPPKSEIRKHGQFYPACKGKCEPILSHMLDGLEVDFGNELTTPNAELKLVFEDEYLAVVNKPAGMLSVPGKRLKASVYSIVKEWYPAATGPLMVHRLDRATSGLMLIAKNKDVHEHLQRQFLTKDIQKRYIAVLQGELKSDTGEVQLPLRVDLDDRPRQLVCYQHGKSAITQYKVIERFNGRTKIYFYPITGRTHQLRVHAAHKDGLNCPIVGDELYGQISSRLHLHAERLRFLHPFFGDSYEFQTDPEFY